MLPDHVQALGEDIEPGGRGAVECGLQRIGLLVAAIGLHHHQVARPEPERLGQAVTAAGGRDDRVEHPDLNRPAGLPPVEDGDQPVRVRGRAVRTGRRVVPGGVRQQEVDPGRIQLQQRLVDGDRVIGDVNRAEQARIQVPVPLRAQQPDRADHLVVAAAPVGVPPVQVVRRPVTVDRDPHLHPEGVEQLAESLVEQHAVGMDPQVKVANAS